MLHIEIVNDGTGTKTRGNYYYYVYVGGREIDRGYVKGHDRKRGWAVLVRKLAIERIARARRKPAAKEEPCKTEP